MGTVIAIESEGGVVIAGDSRETRGGTVRSDSVKRVFDLGGAGTGAVGDAGDVDEFGRRLAEEVRRRKLETDRDPEIGWVARAAAEVATETGVEAVVGASDEEGVPRVRQVGSDGSVLGDTTVALGSGAQLAIGHLEDADLGLTLEETATLAREVMDTVENRDTETGGDVDVWTLATAE
jgi:proteasome beta subunit